jgi:tellurite resistance protein
MTRPSEEEEKYFTALEIEQRAKLRKELAKNAAELEEKRKIAASSGTDDLSVADRVKALGFDGDSARVFDLLPLVHVAWADGSIQKAERAAIFRILESRGIEPGSEAFTTIESLLEERPADAFMRESLAVLQEVVGGEPDRTRSIVDLCVDVATSAGGFLGLGARVSDDEREVIDEVAKILGEAAAAKFCEQVG